MLLLLLTACLVRAGDLDSCIEDVAREQAEDARLHGCRACKPLAIEAPSNCPPKGYDCDATLRMTSNVHRVSGECAQLRCADANATIFVEGATVGRLRCVDRAWISSASGAAASGVCARKCGPGTCATMPDAFFEDNPNYVRFDVHPPDASHPCAWGSCADGAEGSSATVTTTYDGQVEFSCSGDRTWRGPEKGQRHDTIMCKKAVGCPTLKKDATTYCKDVKPGDPTSCTEAVATATAITCTPPATLIGIGTMTGNFIITSTVECRGIDWYLKELGVFKPAKDIFGATIPTVFCFKP